MVKQHTQEYRLDVLKDIIEHNLSNYTVGFRSDFYQNPFHWTLIALDRSIKPGTLGRDLVQSGRLLLNAWYHQIPPELLTAFCHQYGHFLCPVPQLSLTTKSSWSKYADDLRRDKLGMLDIKQFWDVEQSRIVEKYQAQKFCTASRRELTHQSFIKREVYELVKFYKDIDLLDELRQSATEGQREPSKPKFSTNPYYWAFHGIREDSDIIPNPSVSRFAMELLYAEKHQIPAGILIGFLYQVGGISEISRKLQISATEEWLPLYMDRHGDRQIWDFNKS